MRLKPVALPKERAGLRLGFRHVRAGPDLDGDGIDRARTGLACAEHLLLRRRKRNQNDVVLVPPAGALPLAMQHPDHSERDLLNPNDLAERVRIPKEIQDGGLSEQSNFGGALDVLRPDRPPANERPVPGLDVIRGHALDRRGPVEIAVDDLRGATHGRRCHLYGRDLTSDGGGIVFADRELGALPEPDAARSHAAGHEYDEVRAEALDLLGHARLRPRAHAHRDDDSAHADDDAQHRQCAAQFIHPQRADGDPGALPDIHATTSSSRSASCAAASRGEETGSSRSRRPSRNVSVRPACIAMSGSWVTRTIVSPASLRRWSSARISMLVRVSRLPVGSSARTTAGSLTSARAMATRCCCPPESWLGWCDSRSASPTDSSRARARPRRSRAVSPA